MIVRLDQVGDRLSVARVPNDPVQITAAVEAAGPSPEVAEVGDVTRFPSPKRLCSWAGLS